MALRTSIMYHAYVPEPIVRDTSLNGTCVGNGASCECGIVAAMMLRQQQDDAELDCRACV